MIDAALYPQYIRDTFTYGASGNTTCDDPRAGGCTTDLEGLPAGLEDWVPVLVILFITLVNLAGVDWLVRFEMLLGVLCLLPCLAVLG